MDNNAKKLQWVPFGTPEHDELVRKIQKELKSRDFILCAKGHFEADRAPELEKNAYATRLKLGSSTKPFDGDVNVFKSDKFYFVRRDKAEYNLKHRQINVGIIITDKQNRVLTLEKENGYVSLVGGHTDFTRSVYDMTISDLCYHNITKEMSEELVYKKGKLEVPKKPKYYITEGPEMWDLFHAWFVYHLEVDNLDKYKFSSGEPKKHDVLIADIDDIVNGNVYGKVKNSLSQVLHMLVEERKASRVIVNRSVPPMEVDNTIKNMDAPISVPTPPTSIIGAIK